MAHTIKNKNVELRLDLPLENYSGARFDWTAKITTVKYQGVLVTGEEIVGAKPTASIGKGFYNEFGIDSALGYDETEKGDWFHKIGVGLLKKSNEQYLFNRTYEIQACAFDIKTNANSIQIECSAPEYNAYSYVLSKEIILLENGFLINYRLVNNGRNAIVTDEYNHNFLQIAQDLIGDNYSLKLPFPLSPDHVDEYLNPDEVVRWSKDRLSFAHTPKSDFFFSNLTGGNAIQATWELINHKRGIGIREVGDFQTDKVNLWGREHVISPELFFKISLQSGEAVSWARRYEMFLTEGV
jgi:hypothetical protein